MTIFELNQDIHKTNVLTKFHDDWTKYVTSREKDPPPGGYVFLPIRTIFELNSRIQETNVLTKFHKDWAKNVSPRLFTCFHYIHIEKTAPSPGGHAKNVTSRVKKTPPGGHVFLPIRTIFELNRHIQETNILTKFHANWAKNVSSRLFTCLHYIHIEKTAPPPWRPCFFTDHDHFCTHPRYLNKRAKMALVRSPESSRFIQSLPNVKLDLDIDQTNILVKFHHY
ncbi:hypothetical protein DPMN_132879 [Dreissena polymorpha]|uniref:Uncharacterized protein n=1 Tax=Dreissena polymorpha TaxID=45954 RepID=A0A9D4JE89_DREPO|nr:hypothetical protein DPMN_132879 [Dreissena polymorpha]